MGAMTSPIAGADGNVEFLVHLVTAPAAAPARHDGVAVVDAAVDEAIARRS